MTGASPPGPLRCGSTTCSVNAVAAAASKALPPRSRMPIPTAVAIQWVEVTTPKVPSISGRVVNVLGLTLVMYSLCGIAWSGTLPVDLAGCAAPGWRIETECIEPRGRLKGQDETWCGSLSRLG